MSEAKNQKLRRWCFTWNNYTEENVKHLKSLDNKKCDYMIFGFEKCPKTGTPHLQGYVEFSVPIPLSTVKSRLDPILKKKSKLHAEGAQKVRDANVNYCSKEDSRDIEASTKYGCKFIVVSHDPPHQGKRTDWHDIYDDIKNAKQLDEVAKKWPEASIKYASGIEKVWINATAMEQRKRFVSKFDNCKLMLWQKLITKELTSIPDPRKVIWIWDTTGNKGKSWLANYLVAKHEAICFENAKSSDLAFAYRNEPIVIFDFCRSVEGYLNYSAIESFKNGRINSPKYASTVKYFDTPHVICLANWSPDRNKLSNDRWDIRCINDVNTTDILIVDEPGIDNNHALQPKDDTTSNLNVVTTPRNTKVGALELEDNIQDVDIDTLIYPLQKFLVPDKICNGCIYK